MTLSPVFRSTKAVELLEKKRIWDRLRDDIRAQAAAVRTVHADLDGVIGNRFRQASPYDELKKPEKELSFLQEYFFLILFRSLFRDLGMAPERLVYYGELNFCIKGTITAADNLFDGQDKSLLPLRTGHGSTNQSILQLMCFERLSRRACDRGEAAGALTREQTHAVLQGLLNQMAAIGQLEGSEENGVDEIPTPQSMIDRVHRVRGGALFALAFVAPRVLETGDVAAKLDAAEEAVARLGTSFQIVDDLTDFEFDLGRKSHNLLVSQIHHEGTAEERALLTKLWNGEQAPQQGQVEGVFRESARQVLTFARDEARQSFAALAELGFWFPPDAADDVVHAIVGLDGVARMESLSS